MNVRRGGTCFDRQVRQAYEYAKNTLKGDKSVMGSLLTIKTKK